MTPEQKKLLDDAYQAGYYDNPPRLVEVYTGSSKLSLILAATHMLFRGAVKRDEQAKLAFYHEAKDILEQMSEQRDPDLEFAQEILELEMKLCSDEEFLELVRKVE